MPRERSTATAHAGTPIAGAQPADQLGRLLVPPEAGHDVGSGDACPDVVEQCQGHVQADLGAPVAGRPQGRPDRVRGS